MDNEEEFDNLQRQKVLATEPDSLAFVNARRSVKPRKPPPIKRR